MTFDVLVGDVRQRLRDLSEFSVHACICSPPYYSLRAYNTEHQVWGGHTDCKHDFTEVFVPNPNCGGGVSPTHKQSTNPGSYSSDSANRDGGPLPEKQEGSRGRLSAFCQKCGAWKGELGSEPDPDLFVAHLVEVFREVRRVLRPDGLLFVNLGDSFAGSGGSGGDYNPGGSREGQPRFKGTGRLFRPLAGRADGKTDERGQRNRNGVPRVSGLRPKSLIGIPQRFALAMIADGWIWRADMPWVKKNGMPSSAADRPSVSHEWVMMFSQSEKYVWDMDAVRVGHNPESLARVGRGRSANHKWSDGPGGQTIATRMEGALHPNGRSYRTADLFYAGLDELIEQQEAYLSHLKQVREKGGLLLDEEGDPLSLLVNTQGSSLEHYAGYPVKLIEPLIKAATSERGVCAQCGAQWVRNVYSARRPNIENCNSKSGHYRGVSGGVGQDRRPRNYEGWRQSCTCDSETIPAVVLDPFSGTGTTGVAALKHGRNYIGIELNPEYASMSRKRLEKEASQHRIMLFTDPHPVHESILTEPALFGAEDPDQVAPREISV